MKFKAFLIEKKGKLMSKCHFYQNSFFITTTIDIKNVLGQTIISKKFSSQKEVKESFDLSKEGKGMYFVKVVSGEKTETQKIIIQ